MGSYSSSDATLSQPSSSFAFRVETPTGYPHHQLYRVYKDGQTCTFADVISEMSRASTDVLQSQPNSFPYQLVESIKNFPYAKAVFFETPSVTLDTYKNMPFEYMLIPSPALERVQMDTSAFEEKFQQVCPDASSSRQYSVSVVSFTNLSGMFDS